ncbi:MAG: hypothetical protein GX940_08785 [Clostridiaceae bacterium]|nr:hypothetical protein [Clostridiaceae bacterium]
MPEIPLKILSLTLLMSRLMPLWRILLIIPFMTLISMKAMKLLPETIPMVQTIRMLPISLIKPLVGQMLMNQLRIVKQLPAVSTIHSRNRQIPVNKQTRSSNQIQAVLMTLPRIE